MHLKGGLYGNKLLVENMGPCMSKNLNKYVCRLSNEFEHLQW